MKLSAEVITETLRKVDTRDNIPGSVNCQKCIGKFPTSFDDAYFEEFRYVNKSDFVCGACLKRVLATLLSITDKSEWDNLLQELKPLSGTTYMCTHQEHFDLINQIVNNVIYNAGMEIE